MHHCHINDHNDAGMMQEFMLTGTDSAELRSTPAQRAPSYVQYSINTSLPGNCPNDHEDQVNLTPFAQTNNIEIPANVLLTTP